MLRFMFTLEIMDTRFWAEIGLRGHRQGNEEVPAEASEGH